MSPSFLPEQPKEQTCHYLGWERLQELISFRGTQFGYVKFEMLIVCPRRCQISLDMKIGICQHMHGICSPEAESIDRKQKRSIKKSLMKASVKEEGNKTGMGLGRNNPGGRYKKSLYLRPIDG